MKKTWVKREHIYYVPFYKQKSKMFLLCIFLLGIIFFVYQAVTVNHLPNHHSSTPSREWTLEGTMRDLRKRHRQIQASLGRKQSDGDSGGNADNSNNSQDVIIIIRLA